MTANKQRFYKNDDLILSLRLKRKVFENHMKRNVSSVGLSGLKVVLFSLKSLNSLCIIYFDFDR